MVNILYFSLYNDKSDFSSGTNPVVLVKGQDEPGGNVVYHFSDTIRTGETSTSLLADIRDPEGSNNWNDRSVNRFLTGSNDHSPKGFGWQSYDFGITKTLVGQVVKTPATYLHLCLSNLHDRGGAKTWKIQTIKDEKGRNLLLNPVWYCFSGLIMSFEKGGDGARVSLSYATSPCAGNASFPETANQGYATYSIGGSNGDELIFTYPTITEENTNATKFFILDSGFDHLDLKITDLTPQAGIAHLVPQKYPNVL